MNADLGPWKWVDLGFTVTFSLDLVPEDVLAGYGADPARAELLTRQEAWDKYPPNHGGTQLRTGTLNGWGFCFEEIGYQGIRPEVLTMLSARTEVFSFFKMSGKSTLQYFRNGLRIESFEPGFAYSVRGQQPHALWTRTEQLARNKSLPPNRAALEAIEERIGARLGQDLLEGVLLTAYLTDPRPSAPIPTPQRNPPGRFLGSFDPTTLDPPRPPGAGEP
ncbi:DUF6461 domain-containing protein [Micromonospora inyonensis]|uniref:Uncharacterized protein n=1 Tax=Micromonospora inyonensis TaxID=47866 RepID=A0A1C6RKX5_9ACTN|nr:DUF6461 domain-containing protein [Micromonospora inyonensis]SCL17827.1 hypothetical protein GA0074694_2143 [Micromonospora inyonensis]